MSPLTDGGGANRGSWSERLAEACDELCSSLVDPRDAYFDDEGRWLPTGMGFGARRGELLALDESRLAEVRRECRTLAATNEFAINGIENRISYLVGAGHVYRVVARSGGAAELELARRVQGVVDEFLEVNRWQLRQQEIVRRLDRDGEALLRFFVDLAGATRVRFVEPEEVAAPSTRTLDGRPTAADSFGVRTDPDDVETVRGFWIDGRLVDAGEIQHRKANVDANVKRGLPLYFPVRKNLRRVERLLRNMSALAEIQSAIALIRKHRSALRNGVEAFAAERSAAGSGDALGRRTGLYGPGSIVDAPAGVEYDFPSAGVNASNFVAVLQAELRAIAARLVMPEFMFTSDASNGNYASTLVAEGPAVKMFERLQGSLLADDRQVLWRVVQNAAAAGHLPSDVRRRIDLQVTTPSLHVRDQLRECQIDKTAFEKGILSPQSWSQRMGLDYEQERQNWRLHGQRTASVAAVAGARPAAE